MIFIHRTARGELATGDAAAGVKGIGVRSATAIGASGASSFDLSLLRYSGLF